MRLDFITRIHSAIDTYIKPSTVLGIDIGCSSVKVACVRLGATPTVLFRSSATIPEARQGGAVSETIKKMIADNNSGAKAAALAFSDDTIVIRRLELPSMPADDIPNALKWQLKDSLRYDPEKASVDFEFLGQTEADDGSKSIELMVVAVQKDRIERHIAILKDAGLETVWVGASPFAIENSIRLYDKQDAPETFLVLDIGCSKSEISIFSDKKLEFVRSIQSGSSGISDSMAMTLMGERGAVSVSREDAEKIKCAIGIPYDPDVKCDLGLSATQILSMIRPALENISTEVSRSINYYIAEYSGKSAEAVYLTGAGSRMKNIERFISEELSLPVKKLPLPKSIATKAPADPELASETLGAVGAAIGYRSRPNLLPYEHKVEKLDFASKILFRSVVVTLGLILALSFVFEKKRLDSYRQSLSHTQFQRDFLRQIKELHDTVGERYEFLKTLESTEPRPVLNAIKVLRAFLPQSAELTSLRIDVAARTFDISGVVYATSMTPEDILTKFMADLERSKYFKEAELSSFVDAVADGKAGKEFEIKCEIE